MNLVRVKTHFTARGEGQVPIYTGSGTPRAGALDASRGAQCMSDASDGASPQPTFFFIPPPRSLSTSTACCTARRNNKFASYSFSSSRGTAFPCLPFQPFALFAIHHVLTDTLHITLLHQAITVCTNLVYPFFCRLADSYDALAYSSLGFSLPWPTRFPSLPILPSPP
jgi:hypothetical protein